MSDYHELDTDVLIIGGGGAGVRAAIAAAEAGVRVTLLVKGQVAHSGMTAMACPSYQAAIAMWEPGDSPEIAFEDTCREGRYLGDENLIKVLTGEATIRALEMEQYGVKLTRESGKIFQVMHPGHSFARNLVIRGCGYGMMVGLRRELVRHPEVHIIEDVFASRLLMDGDQMAGAVVLDLRKDTVLAIRARSMIVAAGGYEAMYAFNDCEPGATGDGVALAMHAGAALVDLEMILYYPTCLVWPDEVKGSLVQYEGLLGPRYIAGKMLNGRGGEFLPMSERVYKLPVRDVMMKAMFREIDEGRSTTHGGVYIDLTKSPLSPKEMYALLHKLDSLPFNSLRGLGIDVTKEPIEVKPGIHYCLGGVRINEKAETSVPGLYAAGEVAGNVNGANRTSGNALAETQVFGTRAGRYAAEFAMPMPTPELDNAAIKAEVARMTGYLESKRDPIRPYQLRSKLQAVMEREVGYQRNAEGLAAALKEIRRLREEELPRVQAGVVHGYNYEWQEALELENLLDVAEAVVLSADLRQESRGHHFRTDFPKAREEWLKHTRIRRTAGAELELGSVPVVRLPSAVRSGGVPQEVRGG
ncbi:MAG: FAD-binding protein [Dehalococcoidia bacterium]